MSIWNKILIGFIFVASVGFFYLAARTLKTHQYWRTLTRRHEEKIKQLEVENRALIDAEKDGKDDTMGIKPLRTELYKMLIDRGRVWYNCNPGQSNPQTGEVAVTTDQPNPHGIAAETILYVFEEADVADKGSYLGELKVTRVNPPTDLVLVPSMKMKPGSSELQRLASSKGPWTLYEVMPIDGTETFAGMKEQQLKRILPAERVAEYLKDAQLVTTDEVAALGLHGKLLAVDQKGEVIYEDDNGELVKLEVDGSGKAEFVDKDGNVVEADRVRAREVTDGQGLYVRQLRDYEILFRYYHLQRSVLFDLIEAATRDKQYIETALADAQVQVQFREAEKTGLQAELAKYQRERNAVVAHRDNLQAALRGYQNTIRQVIAVNIARAARIAKIQLEAARKIDERTRTMAQSRARAE